MALTKNIQAVETLSSRPLQCEWYVLYTKPRSEQIAKEHLERQGFQVYLPLVATPKRLKGTLSTVIEAYFPRYLFVSLNIEQDDCSPIRSTRGVCDLVKFEGRPKDVPAQLIQALKDNEDPEQLQNISQAEWKAGDRVEIEQGSFAGYDCIFQAHRSMERVAVLINIVGKPTRATLSNQDLQIPQFA
jgi:transcriptional antiterminator RfaH